MQTYYALDNDNDDSCIYMNRRIEQTNKQNKRKSIATK